MAAARALMADYLFARKPDPAHVSASAERSAAIRFMTGTPLGGSDDLRHRYQRLYPAYVEAMYPPVERTSDSGLIHHR